MKESYREGLANHSGPEPCECNCKAAPEALDRVSVGRALNFEILVPGRPWGQEPRRQYGCVRQRKYAAAPRSLRPQACRETPSARTGRPRRCPPGGTGGQWENAMSGKSPTNDGGELYCGIVSTKQLNKGGATPAEFAEKRPQTKEGAADKAEELAR